MNQLEKWTSLVSGGKGNNDDNNSASNCNGHTEAVEKAIMQCQWLMEEVLVMDTGIVRMLERERQDDGNPGRLALTIS